VVEAQLYPLSPVDTLKPVHGKWLDAIHDIVMWHFAALHKRELSYMCPGDDVKLHPHRVKFYRIDLARYWQRRWRHTMPVVAVVITEVLCCELCYTVYIVIVLLKVLRIAQAISLSIPPEPVSLPAVGTNWPFCVDVPLNTNQSINQSINQ